MSPLDSSGIAKIKRFLLFHGPNAFKLDERVSSLVKAVIEPGAEAFDLDRFDGNQADDQPAQRDPARAEECSVAHSVGWRVERRHVEWRRQRMPEA